MPCPVTTGKEPFMNRILARVAVCLFLGVIAVRAETAFRIKTDELYSGTLQYNAADWADWVVFYLSLIHI